MLTPPVFPFFVSSGRAGTTLLRSMFDAHPDLAIPGESHFIAGLVHRRRLFEINGGFATDRLLSELASEPRFRRWGLSEDDLRTGLDDPVPVDLADAVRRLYALYAAGHGKTRYGDKTPRYVLSIDMVADLMPEARFVHVIRDGRDVALSYLSLELGPQTMVEAALRWRRWVTAGRRSGGRLGPGRYLEVRYERLVEEPEATARQICSFIDLDFTDSMLRYFERPDAVMREVGTPENHQHLLQPPTVGMRNWRTQMTRQDLLAFEAIGGQLLSELGYERSIPHVPLLTRAGVGAGLGRTLIRGRLLRSRSVRHGYAWVRRRVPANRV